MRKYVGQPIRRVEDLPFLQGTSRYVDDIKLTNCGHVGIVRSIYSHAIIKSIDTSKLLGDPEILGVYTNKELSSMVKPILPAYNLPDQKPKLLLPFADGRARYVGEPLAVVVAKSKYAVEDALDSVQVDYDPLEPMVDVEAALSSKTHIYEEWGTNTALHYVVKGGDFQEALRKADTVIEHKFVIPRIGGTPMEPRAVAASYDRSRDALTIWSSTQWPHVLRFHVASTLGINENKIQVIAPDVGGGFGARSDLYPEELLVPLAARNLGVPLKWVASRSEDLKTTVHARDQVHYLQLAGRKDGKILGLKDRIVADIGVCGLLSTGPPVITALTFPGPYEVDNVQVDLDCVVTNKTAQGAYRGFGMPEAVFPLERAIDIFAQEIGMDSAAVRMLNLVSPEHFPYRTSIGSVYDSGDYPKCLQRALELSNYERARVSRRPFSGPKVLGIGVAFYNEAGSFGPAKIMYMGGSTHYSGWDTTTVRITKTGKVLVLVGISPHGQGNRTTLAQVCADELQIDIDDITILHGDTNSSPYGPGSWGTRSTVACASMVRAIDRLKKKMRRIAGSMLGTNLREVSFEGGAFRAKDGRRVSWLEVVERAYRAYPLPQGLEPGLEETSNYDPPGVTYAYAANVAVIELDTESGRVDLKDFYIIHDCGNVVNPTIVDGQIVGSFVQGLGSAFMEEFSYDEAGQLLSSTLMDYLIPSACETSVHLTIDHMNTPSPYNNGYKGMSEGGLIGTPAAVANAVDDAMRQLGAGVVSSLPLKHEYVWRLTKEKRTLRVRSNPQIDASM